MLSLDLSTLPANISPVALRRALRAVYYGRSLTDSPLLSLRALDAIALPEDASRTMALRDYLIAVSQQCLDEARRHHGVPDPRLDRASMSALVALGLLQQDFRVGSADLETWSYLYFRYFVKSGRSLRDVAKLLSTTNRTLERRLIAGHARLAEVLFQRERRLMAGGAPTWNGASDPWPSAPLPPSPSPSQELPDDDPSIGRPGDDDAAPDPDGGTLWTVHAPGDMARYYRRRVAEASTGRDRLTQRIVPLPLAVEREDGTIVPGRFASLGHVLAAVSDPAVLVLGPPGSGKSMLLRWLDYGLSAAGLAGRSDRVPVLVELSRYQADAPDGVPPRPLDWLAARWAARQPQLPSLESLLRDGRLVFLLDGLDEIPHASDGVYAERVRAWKHFLVDDLTMHPGNRAVIACRTLAYRVAMSTAAFPISRVYVDGLDAEGVRDLMARCNPERGQEVADLVIGGPLFDLARRPFMAALLAHPDMDVRQLTGGHAAVLTRYVREALERELAADNPVVVSGPALSRHDRARLVSSRAWPTPWDLPEGGPAIRRLASFALQLLQRERTSRTSCVRSDHAAALAALDDPAAADILECGHALGVLDLDLDRNEVRFAHQLWQAYFAARALACDPAPALAAKPWRADEVVVPLEAALAELPPSGTLAPLEDTGWEEALLFAAQMAPDPTAFLGRIASADVELAGRAAECVARFRPVQPDAIAALRERLLERGRAPAADVRARIGAGRILGVLGDPRFPAVDGPSGRHVVPPLVRIAGGTYPIGRDDAIAGHGRRGDGALPAHTVALAAFDIGRFPVTRGEWACFMDAGGYDDERWWDTAAARAWRRGEGTGPRPAEPAGWSADLAPNCPVTGVCWYEARAYARWLADQTGRPFRLPTSVEWEAAARGSGGRPFPGGDALEAAMANFAATHIGTATPVGVFPASDTPDGVADLCGNVAELTSTAWGVAAAEPDFRYPYDPTDGREAADTACDMRRIQRGGAWLTDRDGCRADVVLPILPTERPATQGFRLACDAGG